MREPLFSHERSKTEGEKNDISNSDPTEALRKHFVFFSLPATAMASKASTRPYFHLYDFRNFNGNQRY